MPRKQKHLFFVLRCWGNCLNQEGSICHTEVFPRAEWQITWGPLSRVELRRTLSQAGDGLSNLVVSPSPQGMMTQPNALQSVSTPLVCRIFRSQTESPCTVFFFLQGVRLTWNTAGRFSGVKDFLTACQQWLVTKRKRTGPLDTKWQSNMTKEKEGEIQS